MAESTTHLLLVRHGENDYVVEGRLAGRSPGVHLNEKGRGQAQAVVERLADIPLAAIYSSPLERCRETAEPLAQARSLPVRTHPGLLEVDYGEWQGGKLKELGKTPEWQRVQHHPSRFRFPGGETLREMQNRLVDTVETIRADHSGEVVAVFGHSDPIKSVLAFYLGTPIDLFQRIMIDPTSVSIVALREAGCAILRINDTGPLPDLKPPADKRDEAQAQPEGGCT